jgi:hypothetical protein
MQSPPARIEILISWNACFKDESAVPVNQNIVALAIAAPQRHT